MAEPLLPVESGPKQGSEKSFWNYQFFREYLMAIATAPEFSSPVNQSPLEIALSADWHSILEDIRRGTFHFERWAMIAFRRSTRGIHLPLVPAWGEGNKIPSKLITTESNKVEDRYGIEVIGDIHSHPSGWRIPGAFSAADLYWLVRRFNPYLIMGLVSGNENIFAFRSKETTQLPFGALPKDQASFKEYWQSTYSDSQTINYAVAERFKLAIYKGQSGQNLKRIYPAVETFPALK